MKKLLNHSLVQQILQSIAFSDFVKSETRTFQGGIRSNTAIGRQEIDFKEDYIFFQYIYVSIYYMEQLKFYEILYIYSFSLLSLKICIKFLRTL